MFSGLDGRAVLEAAEELRSPIILGIAYHSVPEISILGKNLRELASRASVPIAIHLDHGSCFEEIIKAVQSGFTSVMLDCSQLSYEENIAHVKNVVETVKSLNISVEAELGHVGQGKNYRQIQELTDPSKAQEFIQRTGISALAVAIGTAHGTYQGTPRLDFDRLIKIKEQTHFPLVLHGSSGTGEENIRKACRLGINKVNVCIDILHAVVKDIQNTDFSGNHAYELWNQISSSVRNAAKYQIELTGSAGKAWSGSTPGISSVLTSMRE